MARHLFQSPTFALHLQVQWKKFQEHPWLKFAVTGAGASIRRWTTELYPQAVLGFHLGTSWNQFSTVVLGEADLLEFLQPTSI